MKETRVKMNKTKRWFFAKINRIQKPLARFKKKEKEKNQINKIRNEKAEVTTDNAEIQRIIRDYYEQLYGKYMENLKAVDRFLENFNFPRLNQEETEIMNNPVLSTEIETVIKKSPKKQKPRGFTGEFCQTCREELMIILPKLFPKISEKGTLPNTFYESPSP